jgi:hypothetical protein
MTGPTLIPTLTTADKLLTVHNITSPILAKIDVGKLNYSCWIFLTLLNAFQKRLVVVDPKIPKDAWDVLEKNIL